jgi:hypothetical protein
MWSDPLALTNFLTKAVTGEGAVWFAVAESATLTTARIAKRHASKQMSRIDWNAIVKK